MASGHEGIGTGMASGQGCHWDRNGIRPRWHQHRGATPQPLPLRVPGSVGSTSSSHLQPVCTGAFSATPEEKKKKIKSFPWYFSVLGLMDKMFSRLFVRYFCHHGV